MTSMNDRSLDPAPVRSDSADSPEDHEPDTVGTPEGDNEYPPDAPLRPAPEGEQVPPVIDTNKV